MSKDEILDPLVVTPNNKSSNKLIILIESQVYSRDNVSKKFDFSILNSISSSYMVLRSIAVFLVYLFPHSYLYGLSIYILTWALDSFDDNVIEKTANVKLKFDDLPKMNLYGIVDKTADYFVNLVFVYWSYKYLPEFFEILYILLIYRLIGLIIYFLTLNDVSLIFFPDTVHYLLGVLIFCKALLPVSYQAIHSQPFWFYAILLSTLIVGFLSELITHVIKPEIMEKY